MTIKLGYEMVHGASDTEVQQVYDHILAGLLKEGK